MKHDKRIRPAATRIVAEEKHAARLVGLGVLLPTAALVYLAIVAHEFGARAVSLSFAAFMLVISLSTWSGFRYRFTTGGVEVSLLGIRLRYIPLPEITEYRVEKCNPLRDFGGWGIRVRRNLRAFILGGRTGVRIRTWHGDVYLGHREPRRIVNDLDRVMKFAH